MGGANSSRKSFSKLKLYKTTNFFKEICPKSGNMESAAVATTAAHACVERFAIHASFTAMPKIWARAAHSTFCFPAWCLASLWFFSEERPEKDTALREVWWEMPVALSAAEHASTAKWPMKLKRGATTTKQPRCH